MSKLFTTPGIILATKAVETEQRVGNLILTTNKNTPLLIPHTLPEDIKLDIKSTDKLLVGGSMPVTIDGLEYQLVKIEQILLVIRD
jgi:hypothetical protein